ncbi:MAG: hypothetical protein NW207_08425 [Cytophagales bacterium]|nr:hypothetical protein [Cytophagales bacterium]
MSDAIETVYINIEKKAEDDVVVKKADLRIVKTELQAEIAQLRTQKFAEMKLLEGRINTRITVLGIAIMASKIITNRDTITYIAQL